MEIREARYFLAVIAQGTFTRASKSLSMPTQTLSQVIRSLESSMGTQLFHRTGGNLELTPAGRAIINPARRLVRAEAVAREAIASLERPFQGRVDIGAMPMLSASLLPEIVRRFRDSYPLASFRIREYDTEREVARAVSSSQVEIGILNTEDQADSTELGSRLCTHAIEHDEFFLVVNSRTAESLPDQLDWNHLPDLPTIGVPVGTSIRKSLDNLIRQAHSTIRHGVTTSHRQMPMKFVASGAGMYFASRRMIDTELERDIVPIRVVPPVRFAAVLVHRPAIAAPTARAFARTVLEEASEQEQPYGDGSLACGLFGTQPQ